VLLLKFCKDAVINNFITSEIRQPRCQTLITRDHSWYQHLLSCFDLFHRRIQLLTVWMKVWIFSPKLLTIASSEMHHLSFSWTSLICFVRRFYIQEDIWGCIFQIIKVTQFCLEKTSLGYWNHKNFEIGIMAYTALYFISYSFLGKYCKRLYLSQHNMLSAYWYIICIWSGPQHKKW
jgi:hypothetical protein